MRGGRTPRPSPRATHRGRERPRAGILGGSAGPLSAPRSPTPCLDAEAVRRCGAVALPARHRMTTLGGRGRPRAGALTLSRGRRPAPCAEPLPLEPPARDDAGGPSPATTLVSVAPSSPAWATGRRLLLLRGRRPASCAEPPCRGSSPIRAKTYGSVLGAISRVRSTRAKRPVSSPPMASGSGISRNVDPRDRPPTYCVKYAGSAAHIAHTADWTPKLCAMFRGGA